MTHVSTTENTALAAAVQLTDAERQPCEVDLRDGLPPPRGQLQHGQAGRAPRAPVLQRARLCPLTPALPGPHAAHWRHHAADHHRLPRSAGGRAVLPGLPLALQLLPQPRTARRHHARRDGLAAGAGLPAQAPGLAGWRGVLGRRAHPAKRACRRRWKKCAPWALPRPCTPAACTPSAWPPCCPARLGGARHQRPRAPLCRHHRRAGQRCPAFESLALLQASPVAFECRTTWHAGLAKRKNFRPWATSWLAGACATGPCRFAAMSRRARCDAVDRGGPGGAQIPRFEVRGGQRGAVG